MSQILNLTFDKTINYFIFNKYAFSIFNKLYIRTTMSNKLVPITDYKLLCYVIYYIGGFFIKYNMWFIENIETKKNIINLKILQYIIHTFIDAMNTIIENNNKNYLYEIYSIKFFNKLNTVYNNINILNTLNAINNKKITIVNNIFKFNIKKIIPIPIEQYDFNKNLLLSSFFSTPKYGPYPTINIIYNKFTDLSFEKIIGKKILNEERNKLINNSLLNIAKLYNLDGTKRKTKLSDIEVINSKYTIDELQSIQNNSERIRLDSINSVLNKIKQKKDKIESQNLESIKLVEELNKIYNKDTDILISSFINKLNDIIGNNNEINILHNIYSLNHNVYIIDHNFLGTKIKPIIINNDDNVIKIKINDNIFKQDIYIYEDASKNISYYSFIEKNLMAYKEYLKEIVFIYNTNCYIKINYSIKYQLKLLGFNYIFNKINYDITNDNSESFNLSTNKNKSYIEIESKKIKQKKNTQEIINKDLDNIHETDKNIIRSIENVTDDSFIIDKYEKNINNLNKFINNILRIRLQNLKNCLSEIQQIIYQIKFQLTSSSLNYIAKLFQSKINYLNTYDDNNNRIFKDWILINNSTYHINYAKDKIKINIKSLSNNNKYIHSEDIIKLVSNCDIILYYIIEQLNLLLDINDDNYIKFNIAYIIINLIIYLFNNYTKNESVLNDINVKKFYLHIINNAEASNFSDEIDITQMTEEELDNFNDEQSNIQEELDAIDADQDEINEDFGDEEILLVDRTSGEY